MVMHFDADRRGATAVGIPLDVKVKVYGDGTRALGSVPDMGEPAQLVATVEKLTGIRIDHLAVLDWQAFSTLIDRVGGVDMSTEGGNGAVSFGGIRMQATGKDALKAVTPQRGGDSVALMQSQLGLMGAVVDGSLHQELHRSPLLVYNFLDAVTENLAVDEEWSVPSMARLFLSVWNLRSGDMKYVTVPVSCVRVRGQCRPKLDEQAAPAFWKAVAQDRADEWLAENNNRGRVQTSR
jgi:LCP family protein required for cell wall assembly